MPRDVVTGAFSYTGEHVARILREKGREVATLTNHTPGVVPEGIHAYRLDFDDPDELKAALDGADTLYNTYWIRFTRRSATFERAIAHTAALVEAARAGGVRRIVHVSIANVEDGEGLPYFDGKAACEEVVRASGCSYAIVRPTVLFGGRDVFISNIAWLLRRFPLFAVAGDGTYGIQPVHVEDHARVMVEAGQRSGNEVFDSAGPEAFTFEGFVRTIGQAIDRRRPVLRVPPSAFLAASHVIGWSLRDVVLNRLELEGLMRGLMVSKEPARGEIQFSEWLANAADSLGRRYANEIARHYR